MPASTSPKKQRLTLTQLTGYDDILTDALVDHVYFWTNIRKNKNAYHSSRGITEEDVTSILQKAVIVAKDPSKAETELLGLSGLKKYSGALETEKERDDFRKHMRKYINIYLPDCPFEVSSTNRYTVVTHEAAVTARRYIKKGEVVKYLSGIQVIMTEDEEEDIKNSRRDFSIVVSSRNKAASLFLGPARFANHDCGANARLMTSGNAGMDVIAVRDIDIGDEITVSYGKNYFGEDNCECLCKTCEDNFQNGWSRVEGGENQAIPKLSIEEAQSGYSFRQRRRLSSEASSRDQSMTPDIIIRPQVSKTPRSLSRFKNAESPITKSPPVEPSVTPLKRKRELEILTPSPSRKAMKTVIKKELSKLSFSAVASTDPSPSTSASASRRGSPSPSETEGQTCTDATSVDEDTIIVQPELICPNISKVRKARGSKARDPSEQAKFGDPILVGKSTSTQHHTVQKKGELDDLINDSAMTISPPKSSSPQGRKKRKRKTIRPVTDKDHAPRIRVPGDYVLTSALLAEPASSWIVCKICEEPFVQKDAYFTRSSCPRCERHSKLYGYMWPKTDKEGKNDTEERVLDHRTVHRFIKPEEERIIRKRGRSSTGSRAVTRDVSEAIKDEEKEDKEDDEPKPKKARGRGRPPKRSRLTM